MPYSGLVTSIFRFSDFITTEAFADATWSSVKLVTWSVIEPSMYHIAACLPACRPLVIFLRRKLPARFGVGQLSRSTESRNARYELSALNHPEHNTRNGNVRSKSNGFARLGGSTLGSNFGNTSTEKIVPVTVEEHFGHEISGAWAVESGSSIPKTGLDADGIHVTHDYHVSSSERPWSDMYTIWRRVFRLTHGKTGHVKTRSKY